MENRRFEVVLFDLGGTLMYFRGEWSNVEDESYRQLHRSLRESGLDLPEQTFIKDVRSQIGVYHARRETDCREYTTLSILHKVLEGWGYPAYSDEELQNAIASMYAVSQQYWQVEHDALAMLQELRENNYRLGLLSNAGDDADVQALIDKAGIRHFFELILTSAAQGIRKPDVHIFRSALDHFSVKPHQGVMVGDTLYADVLGANNSGLFSIWINRRVELQALSEKERKIQPGAVITTLDELPSLLKSLEWG